MKTLHAVFLPIKKYLPMKSIEKDLFAINLLVDLFVLNSCIVLLSFFRIEEPIIEIPQLLVSFVHFNGCWIITYFAFGRKNLYLSEGFSHRIYRITKKMLIYIVIAGITSVPFFTKYYSIIYFSEFVFLFYFGLISAYLFVFKFSKYKRIKGLNTIRTVIVSNCEKGYLLRRIIESNPMLGCKLLGFIVHNHDLNQQDVLGSIDEIEELIREHQIQMIFSVQEAAYKVFNQSLASICDVNGIRLRYIVGQSQPNNKSLMNIEILNHRTDPRDVAWARISKRLFDICFSSFFILFVFSWLFPVVILIIKLTSKGPVFFCQKRTGFNNKIFTCIKFRTMRVNAQSDLMQASVNDGRITPVGRFLRDSHLDEFPQLLNVLMGQMSVVGPRPHMLTHTAQYSELIKDYLIRHYVKPGITGWAQVNGFKGETDELWKMEKRVEYDMCYINNWTFFWDLNILWNTLFKRKVAENDQSKSDILRPCNKEFQSTGKNQLASDRIRMEV